MKNWKIISGCIMLAASVAMIAFYNIRQSCYEKKEKSAAVFEPRVLFDIPSSSTLSPMKVKVKGRNAHYYLIEDAGSGKKTYIFASSDFAPGVKGFAGPLSMAVMADEKGIVKDFRVLDSSETPAYLRKALEGKSIFLGKDIFTPETEYDTVSGATFTSHGISATLHTAGSVFAELVLKQHKKKDSRNEFTFDRIFAGAAVFLLFIIAAVIVHLFIPPSNIIRVSFLALVFLFSGIIFRVQFSMESVLSMITFSFPSFAFTAPFLLLALLPLVLVFTGNIYCGYLCPFGALQEIIGKVFACKYAPGKKVWSAVRFVKYVILFLLLGAFISSGLRSAVSGDPLISAFSGAGQGRYILFLIMYILSLSLFFNRFWCRNLCPSGAFLSLFNKISILSRLSFLKRKLPLMKPGRCDMGVSNFKETDCLNCDRCRISEAPVEKEKGPAMGRVGILYILFALTGFVLVTIPAFRTFAGTDSSVTSKYKDGAYTGIAKGYDENIIVSVTIASGRIQSVKVVSHNESSPKTALEKIPSEIIAKQGVEGVDSITGATYSSKGVINAVKNALLKASGKEVSSGNETVSVLEAVQLPSPALASAKSFADALKYRRTIRDFDSKKELSLQIISNLLWAACGVNREDGKFTAPTAFNWQEISIYAATSKGTYKYNPKKHILEAVNSGDIRAACGIQPFLKEAPLVLIYVAEYWKMTGQGGADMLKFYSAVDTGYISQNVYLFCASEGLATVAVGGIDKPALEKLLKLRSENQSVILAQPVAYPKYEKELKNN